MFVDIARFLLNTTFTLFGAALLLRAWLTMVWIKPYNPLLQAILKATNWLVLPLRCIIPASRCIDWTSLFAAWLAAITFTILIVTISGGNPVSLLLIGLIVSALIIIKWALNLIIWLTLIMVLLSWFNPSAPAIEILLQLTAPLLNLLRRSVPPLGRIDLSPLVLLILVEILLIIVTHITVSLTMFGL
ncbi:YggT family protein [Candidatus Vallotia lariciata]|uniref:YggT family protein n=1 Tax=Candidatus Vallotia laricis TaxID=2018052 RepID=UPI001D014D06|nr:YggT family protein [Candidatus Vallotia lariciata]UDG83239.1 hypothetical protein GKR41_00632 [Candidatus Vallotia lariciata]